MATTLNETQAEYLEEIGQRPESIQQMVSFCQQRNLAFSYKQINEWWPTRAALIKASRDQHKSYGNRSEYIVHGFLRETEKELSLSIASAIMDVCLSFFKTAEYFALSGDALQVSNDDTVVSNDTATENTAYGAIPIILKTDTNSIYKWTVKIKYKYPEMHEIDWSNQMGPKRGYFYLGIDAKPQRETYLNSCFYTMYLDDDYSKTSNPNYSLNANGAYSHYIDGGSGRWSAYHFRAINDGDVITMELNTKLRHIKYHKNGEVNNEVAFQGTKKPLTMEFDGKDCVYYLAVCLKEASMELVQFEHVDIP